MMSYASFAQQGIKFTEGDFSQILTIAKDKEKNVFIDTYADWCKPCKRMEKKFRDKDVARFFNSNFINYRVNMQNPQKANQLRKKYDIVFLPTMLIVDPNGVIKYQVDRELSTLELINMGKTALDPGTYFISESTSIRRNTNNNPSAKPYSAPTPKIDTEEVKKQNKEKNRTVASESHSPKNTKPNEQTSLDQYETIEESSNKILKVLGKGELPPEILLQEAYDQLELMDGSHRKTAKKYLTTQPNWDTDINRKFIFDFVDNATSPEYDFMIQNRESFNIQFGEESVDRTVEIITYRALHNAVPRPTLEESIQLYKNLGAEEPYLEANRYFITRLIAEDKKEEVISFGDQFLETSPLNPDIQYTIADYLAHSSPRQKKDLWKAESLMQKAANNYSESIDYFDLLGKIYYELELDAESKKAYQTAIRLAKKQGANYVPASAMPFSG